MTRGGVCAQFIGEPGRRLFALLRTPGEGGGECTLVVPPFAEEMNKSRRIVTELAQHEREQGRGVLSIDLSGTGDSEGTLDRARIEHWIDELASAVAWSAAQGWRVHSVLGIRFGAILAAALAHRRELGLSRLVFWQPVTSGARMIDQFLRIRVMASRLEDDRHESVAALRGKLQAGETVDVAGYVLSGALCADIDALDLHGQLAPAALPIRWLEVVADSSAPPSPATQRAIERARAIGCQVEYRRVTGEPFWTATEIVTNAALVAAS